MKPFSKYLAYSLTVVFLIIGSIFLFKNHPDVQLPFLLPGLFILAYSVIRDDVMSGRPNTFRALLKER